MYIINKTLSLLEILFLQELLQVKLSTIDIYVLLILHMIFISGNSVENITYDVVLNNKEKYKQACKECGVIPASYFLRNMTNQRLNIAHHGLGEKGAKAISIALMVGHFVAVSSHSDSHFLFIKVYIYI